MGYFEWLGGICFIHQIERVKPLLMGLQSNKTMLSSTRRRYRRHPAARRQRPSKATEAGIRVGNHGDARQALSIKYY